MAEINLKKLSAGVSEIEVFFNEETQGFADATIPLNVNLTDGVDPIIPTSVALTGNDLDITIVPSGVFFKTIEPMQYTSYRTGDEGYRNQNGYFDYTPPTNAKSIAELDYSIGANYFFKLKTPLVVNGVSSTQRFVDINGVQVFSATGNANLMLIDKLTGMMITRVDPGGNLGWNSWIDDALTYSVVINSVTYDDFYLTSLPELTTIMGTFFSGTTVDPLTGNTIFSNSNSTYFSATTVPVLTTAAQSMTLGAAGSAFTQTAKLLNSRKIYITNVRNLITAP